MYPNDNIYFIRKNEKCILSQHVRSHLLLLIHRFFSSKGFILVDPPILHEQIPNKKYEVYVPLYGGKYSLNSSNALYMGAYASLFGRVYAISSTFRDELCSGNHLLEFRMLEVEILDMTFNDLPQFIENFILFILQELTTSKIIQENRSLAKRIDKLLGSFPLSFMSYENFIHYINQSSQNKLEYGVDISSVDFEITNLLKKPVFIIDYPRALASWTAKSKSSLQAYALNLLLPDTYGELCEGCERNNDIAQLRYKLKCANISCLQWYLDAIEKVKVSRCGFGIGIDRLVRWIVGLNSIQDSILFPRIKQL